MEGIFEEIVPNEDLQRFEDAYNAELKENQVSAKVQFEYAWCLVRSRYAADIKKGVCLLEDLYSNHKDANKRDCLYYLAIGNARLKNYSVALRYVKRFLEIEPGNEQVQHLEELIRKKMRTEGLTGLAVAGGTVAAVAAVAGVVIALCKK